MGSRGRRRERERAKQQAARNGAVKTLDEDGATQLLLPSEQEPLLRIVIGADVPEESRELCARYWALDADGSWTNRVSQLGLSSWVTATVTNCSQALAVHLLCGQETPVRSRSAMAFAQRQVQSCPDCAAIDGTAEGRVPAPRQETEGAQQEEERDFTFPPMQIAAVPHVPEELVAIGMEYWAVADYDHESAVVQWQAPVASIGTRGWGRAHIAAAAGVSSVVPTHACAVCGGALTLTSRTSYASLCAGTAQVCVSCTPGLPDKIQKLLTPKRATKPHREKEEAHGSRSARDPLAQCETLWREQQIAARDARYPDVLTPEAAIPEADVAEEVATLSLLRFSPQTSPIPPVRHWPADPLHPIPQQIPKAVAGAVQAGLLRVHSDTPLKALLWNPRDLREALTLVDGDLDNVPAPQLTDRYYARDASHYSPYGTSMGKAADALDAHLVKRLDLSQMVGARREQFLNLVQHMIAAEAVRYFDYQLEIRHLPPVPDNHVARLNEAATRAASTRSLGQLNNMAWRAVVRASDAAQKYPQAPRANMTTHAVNAFESAVQDALASPGSKIKPYDHDRVSAMSRIIFYTILDANPFLATLDDARNALPLDDGKEDTKTPDESRSTIEPAEIDVLVRWLRENQNLWTVEDFREHLLLTSALQHVPDSTACEARLAEASTALQKILKDNLESISAPVQATLNTCTAARLLTKEVQRDGMRGPVGAWIVDEFAFNAMQKTLPSSP